MNLVNEQFITLLGLRLAKMEQEIIERDQHIEDLEAKIKELRES